MNDVDAVLDRLSTLATTGERRAYLDQLSPAPSPAGLVAVLKNRSQPLLRDHPDLAQQNAVIADEIVAWSGNPEAQAIACWLRANAYIYEGRHRECLELYQAARTYYLGAGDRLKADQLLSNCAAIYAETGEYAAALESLDQVQANLPQHDSDQVIARTRSNLEKNRSVALQQLDRYEESLAACERGKRSALLLGEPVEVADHDINRAVALEGLGRYQEAVQTLLGTLPALDAAHEQLTSARALMNLGWLRFHVGDYRQALLDLDAAGRRFAQMGNSMEVASVNLHKAQVNLRLNLLPETIRLCRSAQNALREEHGVARYAALADYYAGVAFGRLGEQTQALNYLAAARAEMERLGLSVQTAIIDLERADLLLGGEATETAGPQEARRLARDSLAVFENAGLKWQANRARLILGDAHQRQEDAGGAAELYHQVLSGLGEHQAGELYWRAWFGLGQLAELGDNPAQALDAYRRAIQSITEAAVNLGESELTAGFLFDKASIFQAAIRLHLARGENEQALRVAESARSLVMAASGETRQEQGQDAGSPELIAEMQRLRQEWRWRYDQLTANALDAHNPRERGVAHKEQEWRALQEIEQALRQLWRVRRLRVGGRGQRPLEQMADLTQELSQHIAADQVVLAYCLAQDRVALFVIDSTAMTAMILATPWPEIRRRLDRLHFALRWRKEGAAAHLAWLGRALVEPASHFLVGRQRLTIAPADRLYHAPFHAFLADDAHLLENIQVDYAPSMLHLLGSSSDHPRQTPDAPALIFADSFAGRLPETGQEARAIQRLLAGDTSPTAPPQLFLNEDATAARLFQLAPHCRILHIAAHSHFRQDNPRFSELQLGDGPLLLADLDELRLYQRPLVTLSACETGVGDVHGADILGISQAFLRAGAGQLLVSLWRVPDEATARLMELFYTGLQAGLPGREALRRAQITLLGRPETAHPFHWAGWVLVGG